MIATEARSLSELRKTESWLDYTLRTLVYPGVELAACQGLEAVSMPVRPLWTRDWNGDEWNARLASLAAALEQQGYTVDVLRPRGDRVDVDVRVSW